jgi:hypothetical protein
MADSAVPQVVVGANWIPSHQTLLPITITVGREDPTAQPDANSASFGYVGPVLPHQYHRGNTVNIWLHPQGSAGSNRFSGRIANIEVTPYPDLGLITARITCVGRLTDLADRIIGDNPWPIETDYQRVWRIGALLGNDPPFVNEGSPDLRLRARDVDRRKALELLHLFAGTVGSIVWEHPDGSVHYQAWDYRDIPLSDTNISLPASAIITDATWAMNTEQLIDRVRVEFGPDTDGVRADYATGVGSYETLLSGEAADHTTAAVVGDTVVARWGRTDLWDAPVINTRSDLLDVATYDALRGLLPSDTVTTTGLTLGPSPGSGDRRGLWFVEGWTETYDRAGDGAPLVHEMQLSVSDVQRFVVVGENITDFELVLTPPSYGMSQGVWAVTFRRVGYPPLPYRGVVSLTIDGNSTVLPFDLETYPTPPTSLNWTLTMNMVPPGVHTVQAAYSGYRGQYRPAVTGEYPLTVTDTGFSLVTLTTSNPNPRVGDTLSLVADMFNDDPEVQPGDGWQVSWLWSWSPPGTPGQAWYFLERGRDVGSPQEAAQWIVDDVDPAWGYPISSLWWKAEVKGPGGTSTSNIVEVKVKRQVTRTLSYGQTWSQVYDGFGNPILAIPPNTHLSQGDYGDEYGDRRSLVGFAIPPTDWEGWYITGGSADIYTGWMQTPPGTVRIGTHGFANAPAVAMNDDITRRVDVDQWAPNSGLTIDITGWVRTLVHTGTAQGLAFGPAERDDVPAMALDLQGAVTIHITGSRWEDIPPVVRDAVVDNG